MNFKIIPFSVATLLCFLALPDGSLVHAQSVKDSWSSQQSAVASTKIHFLKSLIECDEAGPTLQQVTEIVDNLSGDPNEALLADFIRQMNPALDAKFRAHDQQKQPWKLWDERVLLNDGFSERSTGEQDEHIVANGMHLLHNLLIHHVTCYDIGQCDYYYHGLEWLLCLPPIQVLDTVTTMQENKQQQLTLSWTGGSNLVLDAISHLPIYEETRTSTGEIVKATYFREITTYPGEITIPAVRIQVSFRNGIAYNAMITVIKMAEFNLELPEDAFALSLATGGVLADVRQEQRHARRLKNDVASVSEFFLASASRPPNRLVAPVQKQFDWKAFLLIINGVFLIVLGVFLWKRAR